MKTPALLSAVLLLVSLIPAASKLQLHSSFFQYYSIWKIPFNGFLLLFSSCVDKTVSTEDRSPVCDSRQCFSTPYFLFSTNFDFPFLGSDLTPFTVLVANSVKVTPCKNYTTAVVFRGILLGGLKRLQNSTKDFMSVHYFFKQKH